VQETGRAGRNGEASESVLYVGHADIEWSSRIAKGADKAKLGAMVEYATEARCRRARLLGYFGEKGGQCKAGVDEACDVCADARVVRKAAAAAEAHRQKLVRPRAGFCILTLNIYHSL
jgi:ATP-dependent DNA helicase RecQ